MSEAITASIPVRAPALHRAADFFELTKPRIAALVLAATAVGFYLAVPWTGWNAADGIRLINTLLGTALVAAGANALNQVLEAPLDAMMMRTLGRPIPSGRLTAREAATFGIVAGLLGFLYLAIAVNALTATLAALSLINYVLVYTPLKRLSSVCVLIGAVSGALPPVIGWAGGAGSIDLTAWLLFTIVFFWQLPHFASISWLYREDYGRAGYPLIPVVHGSGVRFDLHLMSHTVTLLAVSVLPSVYGVAGLVYAVSAMLLGLAFLGFSLRFVLLKTSRTGRAHVVASVVYLPLLLGALMLDRVLTS